jgi:small basic protein
LNDSVELARPSLSTRIDFNVPEFSFVSVAEDQVCIAVMPIKSNATGVYEIPLSFITFACFLGTLTHVFNHRFPCSVFLARWRTSVVLPVLKKVALPVKYSGYSPISLLACLSKVFKVLMARQKDAHIQINELLTLFPSGFRRQYSTTAAVLKVTEDIGLNIENGQTTPNCRSIRMGSGCWWTRI